MSEFCKGVELTQEGTLPTGLPHIAFKELWRLLAQLNQLITSYLKDFLIKKKINFE